jgi:hypothetical protein
LPNRIVFFSVFRNCFRKQFAKLFLTKKQLKIIFCFCSRKQFLETKIKTNLPNELLETPKIHLTI